MLGGKCKSEVPGLAGRGALDSLLELNQRLATADDDGHIASITAFEGLAVDLAVEIQRHPVAIARGTIDLSKDRTLTAHALDHGVDIRIRHFGNRAFDGQRLGRAHRDLRKYLEYGGVLQVRVRRHPNRLDARP